MNGISEVRIENKSRLTMLCCVQTAARLMESEADFIASSRVRGCSFDFGGVIVGVFPICPAYPENILAFIFSDDRKDK